jgi:quercetin dioxygenase-like cupin family protein
MQAKHSVHETEVTWKDYDFNYPKWLRDIIRAKVLIGPDGAIKNSEISMAVMEIDPGCTYPLHSHDAPEIYFVLEGEAKCLWNNEEFLAVSGTAIQTTPGTPHSIEVVGENKFRAIALWWAPGGKAEVLDCKSNLLESADTK